MPVLATQFSNSMSHRSGYLTANALMDDDFTHYIFKDCIKISDQNFSQWVCYWEDFPVAVVCVVKSDKLSNGFVKAYIIEKKVIPVSEIGQYSGKRSHFFGQYANGKMLTTKESTTKLVDEVLRRTSGAVAVPSVSKNKKEKVTISNDEIKNLKDIIKSNWKIELK